MDLSQNTVLTEEMIAKLKKQMEVFLSESKQIVKEYRKELEAVSAVNLKRKVEQLIQHD